MKMSEYEALKVKCNGFVAYFKMYRDDVITLHLESNCKYDNQNRLVSRDTKTIKLTDFYSGVPIINFDCESHEWDYSTNQKGTVTGHSRGQTQIYPNKCQCAKIKTALFNEYFKSE